MADAIAVVDAAEMAPLSPPASYVVWTPAYGPGVGELMGKAGFYLAFSGNAGIVRSAAARDSG